MVVSDCDTTLGAIRGVVGKLCTTRRTVVVRHATALGEVASRYGGRKSYPGISKNPSDRHSPSYFVT
jgi:hypothetical protein